MACLTHKLMQIRSTSITLLQAKGRDVRIIKGLFARNLTLPLKMSHHWPVADPREAPSPMAQNVLNFMQIWENLTKSYVGIPPEGWCPLLQGILDLPLLVPLMDTMGSGPLSLVKDSITIDTMLKMAAFGKDGSLLLHKLFLSLWIHFKIVLSRTFFNFWTSHCYFSRTTHFVRYEVNFQIHDLLVNLKSTLALCVENPYNRCSTKSLTTLGVQVSWFIISIQG